MFSISPSVYSSKTKSQLKILNAIYMIFTICVLQSSKRSVAKIHFLSVLPYSALWLCNQQVRHKLSSSLNK